VRESVSLHDVLFSRNLRESLSAAKGTFRVNIFILMKFIIAGVGSRLTNYSLGFSLQRAVENNVSFEWKLEISR
jgi:hypothetical protein